MRNAAFDRIEIGHENPEEVFEIIEGIGSGNFGMVLKARHRTTEEVVAIKQVPLTNTDKEDIDSIVKEVEILQQCRHPNIVRFHGTYQSLGFLWIVMEYCEGGSVDLIYELLRRPLSEPLIAYVCRQVLQGLRYLHERHCIHRDVKGSNILLTRDGQVKLADFGVSTELKHTLSRRNSFIGTALWMAPEALTEKDYDNRVDIWSLGITTIELAEGQPPYLGMHMARAVFFIPLNDPPTLQSKERWSPQLNLFIKRLLAKDKELRPSAATMLNDPFVLPEAVASQSDMAAVVEQLLHRKKAINDKQHRGDYSSAASTLTIVTRNSSESEDTGDEGGELPPDEASESRMNARPGHPGGASHAATKVVAEAGPGGGAPANLGDGNGGGHLVSLPLLHLEDISFDALTTSGGSTAIWGPSTATITRAVAALNGNSSSYLHSSPTSKMRTGEGQFPPNSEAPPAAGSDPTAEAMALLGRLPDHPHVSCATPFDTAAATTVRDAFLYYHRLPYTREVPPDEAKGVRNLKFWCGSILKNLYYATAESKRSPG